MLSLLLLGVLALITLRKLVLTISETRYRKVHGLSLAPRSPQSERILGLSLFKLQQRHEDNGAFLQKFHERRKERGPTGSSVLMGREFISTTDPENVKAVLATQFDDFNLGERSDALVPLLGRGIITVDGPHWRRSRALIRPSLAKAQISDLSMLEEHVRNLLNAIPNGSTVDLQRCFFDFSLDSATHFIFGQPVGIQLGATGSEADRFSRAFDDAQAKLQSRVRLGPLRCFLWDRTFQADCRFVRDWVEKRVLHALQQVTTDEEKKRTDPYDLVAELAQSTTDRVQLCDELINVLLGARDTTASLLSSVFFMLARDPDVWARLQEEVGQLGGERPSSDRLREMRYVRAVLNETLRLFPPVSTNLRYATRHTSLPRGGGDDGSRPIFVARGTAIFYSVWAIHRSIAIYGPDAETFRPERWIDNENDEPLRPGWGFLPFNGGPRICLGQQKALTEAAYVLVCMLQTFNRVECRDSRPWREHLGLVTSSYHGVRVGLWRYSGSSQEK